MKTPLYMYRDSPAPPSYQGFSSELSLHDLLLSVQVRGSQDLLEELLLFISGGEHQVILFHPCHASDHLRGGHNNIAVSILGLYVFVTSCCQLLTVGCKVVYLPPEYLY